MSSRRNDRRSLKRQRPRRDPKKRILIVCEGSVTEPRYFKALQHHPRNPLVHVKVADAHGVPLTVVECAIEPREQAAKDAVRYSDENLAYEEVWGVFDIDDHPKVPEAKRLAAQRGIALAVSNPCFELWALLHFRDHRAHIGRGKLRPLLKAHLPAYEKELEFDQMKKHHPIACKRAQQLDADAERQSMPGRNPTTGVYKLAARILAAD